MKKSDNIKKIVKSFDINDFEVETDNGFVDMIAVHMTVPYKRYGVVVNGIETICADKHILFKQGFEEVFVDELNVGDEILINGGIGVIDNIIEYQDEENMFDIELVEESDHRYFTNNLLSHNTQLAKKIAEEIYGDERALIRLDMSEYTEKNSVTKLYGSAPGYIGYESGGQLTEAVKNKPYSVILLDEIEKADPEVYNVFLQLFDEGRLTDSSGQLVSFKNCIVLMTSNIGVKQAAEIGAGIGFNADETSNKRNVIEKQLKNRFAPEFINRIDKIVYFNTLTDDNLKDIIRLEMKKLNKRLSEMKYSINFDDKVVDYIHELTVKERQYGARPIIRLIQENIEDNLADLMLNNDYEPSYVFNSTVRGDNIVIE